MGRAGGGMDGNMGGWGWDWGSMDVNMGGWSPMVQGVEVQCE